MAKTTDQKLKNVGMVTIRNSTKSRVNTVLFPNGAIIKPELKVEGIMHTTEVMNAGELREAGTPITPANFVFTPDVMLVKADATGAATPDRETDIVDLITSYGFDREISYQGFASSETNLSSSFSYMNLLNSVTAFANSGKPLYVAEPRDMSDNSVLAITGSEGTISFYTEAANNRGPGDQHLALKLEFSKNRFGDVRYHCLNLRQFLSGADASEGAGTEVLRSVHVLNPFVIRGKSRDVQLTRIFTVKKLEPGEGGLGGPEGPMFDLTSSPQPITLNADQDGNVTLSSADKTIITCHVSGSQVTYDRPNNAGESIAPSNDSNFTIDMGGKNLPTADFVDAAGNVTSISSANVAVNFAAKTVTFSNSSITRLVLNVDQTAGLDGIATVTTASREISSGNTWVSCTVNFKAFVNRNGTVIPSGDGFHLPIHIVKNIPLAPVELSFTNPNIAISTNHLGGHPITGVQMDNGNGDSTDNIPSTAFTKIDCNAGTTNITFGGHKDNSGGEPALNTYRIISNSITAATDNGTATENGEATTAYNNSTGASDGDTSYFIQIDRGGTTSDQILNFKVETDSSDAKLSVHILDIYETGTTRFDSIVVQVPIRVNNNGILSTITKTLTVSKIKAGSPTPIVTLSKEVISIPTTHFGTNPDDGQFFAGPTDFADGLDTILKVEAGGDSLTWFGEVDNASPPNPAVGSFRINPIGITGNTDNGTVLTPQDHDDSTLGPSSPSADFRLEFRCPTGGRVFRLAFSASGGGVKIDMHSLGEFDNTTSASHTTGGTQRYDSIFLNIPVMVNVSGTTVVINKSLTIQKNKSAAPTVDVSFTKETIDVETDHYGRHPILGVQLNNYAAAGLSDQSTDNIPSTAFTEIRVIAGDDVLIYEGHQDTGNPSVGKYQIVSGDVVMKTIGLPRDSVAPVNSTGIRELATTLETTPGGYPDVAQNPANPSVGGATYEIFGRNGTTSGQVVFGVHVAPSNAQAKISVSVLDWTDGSDGSATLAAGHIYDSVEVTVPVKVNFGGTVTTHSKTFTVQKIKPSAPTPIVNLTKSVISIPTTSEGTNPDDGQFFAPSDFSAGQDTVLTVTAGGEQLSWHGDADTTSPSDPPRGSFRINPIGITGNTDNGVVLTAQDHAASPSLDAGATSTDKNYRIEFKNQESTPGTVLRLEFTASGGGVKIDMSSLGEFDNSEINYVQNGSQRFDSISLNIPVIVNVSGTPTVVNKSLTIQKIKTGASSKSLSLSLNTSTVTRVGRNSTSLSPSTVNLTVVHQNMDAAIGSSGITATGADGTDLTSRMGTSFTQSTSGNTVTTSDVYTPAQSTLFVAGHYPITVTATHEGLTDSKTISLTTQPAQIITRNIKFRVQIDGTHNSIGNDTRDNAIVRLNLPSGIQPANLGDTIPTSTVYRGNAAPMPLIDEEIISTGVQGVTIDSRPYEERLLSMHVPLISPEADAGRIMNVVGSITYFNFSSDIPTVTSPVANTLGCKWFLHISSDTIDTANQSLPIRIMLDQPGATGMPDGSGGTIANFPSVVSGTGATITNTLAMPGNVNPDISPGLVVTKRHFITFSCWIVNLNNGKTTAPGNNIVTGTMDVDVDVTYEA